GLRGGSAFARQLSRPRGLPPYSAECAAGADRPDDPDDRDRNHLGSQPVLPRAWSAAAGRFLGFDPQYRAAVAYDRTLDRRLAGHDDLSHRLEFQPSWRRPAGRLRSAQPLSLLSPERCRSCVLLLLAQAFSARASPIISVSIGTSRLPSSTRPIRARLRWRARASSARDRKSTRLN